MVQDNDGVRSQACTVARAVGFITAATMPPKLLIHLIKALCDIRCCANPILWQPKYAKANLGIRWSFFSSMVMEQGLA
ncbi:hypothetical protein V6N13_021467 [Hibiscus sabdariffa]